MFERLEEIPKVSSVVYVRQLNNRLSQLGRMPDEDIITKHDDEFGFVIILSMSSKLSQNKLPHSHFVHS